MWDIPGPGITPCPGTWGLHHWAPGEAQHLFFIQVSADGHLGCFLFFFTIINSTAMNILMPVSIWISVFIFFWVYTEECNCWIVWYFDFYFWGAFILFSIRATPVYIPTNSVWVLPFLQNQNFVICRLFNSYSDRCEAISHCAFDFCFSNN